jgi:hypothetical protein
LVPPGSENEADAPKCDHQCRNQERGTGQESEPLEETDNQREKQRSNKGKARRFMVDEFLMRVCDSEEAKKAPECAAREENPDRRHYLSRIASAGSYSKSDNCSDREAVKQAQRSSASFAEGPNVRLVCHAILL